MPGCRSAHADKLDEDRARARQQRPSAAGTPWCKARPSQIPSWPAPRRRYTGYPSVMCRRIAAPHGVKFVQEFLGLFGDSAAQDDEVGPQQAVQFIEHQIQLGCPGVPAQISCRFGAPRGALLGFAPGHLKMAEFRIRHELAIDEQCAADAGSPESNSRTVPGTSRAAPYRSSASPAASASLIAVTGLCNRLPASSASDLPIHDLLIFAAVRTMPLRMTLGNATPTA